MTTGQRKTNDFCWIDLMTPDGAKARAFYAKLFGWTYGEMPGVPGGRLINVDGLIAGALMDLDVVKMPATGAVIGPLIRVDHADAAVAKINALGGHADPAFDVLEHGRKAMCKDPNGAIFAVWQPKKVGVMESDSHAHGAPSWFETLTTDAVKASAFYSGVFGWTVETVPMPGGESYKLFKMGDRPIAGAMAVTPRMKLGNIPPHWATYFTVKSVRETETLAAELGAKVCMPTMEIPNVGWFAMFTSPQGVPFHVIEWKP